MRANSMTLVVLELRLVGFEGQLARNLSPVELEKGHSTDVARSTDQSDTHVIGNIEEFNENRFALL